MADMVTAQELKNAKIDARTIGESVNENKIVTPRYGAPFKSMPMIAEEMQSVIGTIIAGGVPASIVADASGKTQQEINYLSQNIIETEYRLLDFIPRNLHSKIKDYTSLADVSAYVQAAIDEVGGLGGGTILIPRGMIWACVELKDSVQLVGSNSHSRPAYNGNKGTVWRNANDAFASIVTPSTRINACGIAGIQFRGKSANSIGGVRFGDTFGASLKNCSFNTFKDEAFIAEGLVGTYEDLIAVNTLLQRERTERTGCFKFLGADHYISKIEGNTGITGVINPDLNLAGIYVGGSNHYVDKLMGELSEVGVFVTNSGAAHKITASRADLNFGHGWLLGGGNSNLVNCHAHNNSKGSNGVYSGFKAVETSASQHKLHGCFGTVSSGYQHRYDFDLVDSDIDAPAPRGGLWNCKGTRNLPVYHGSLGSQQTGLIRTSSANPVTTVNVDNLSTIRLEHNLDGLVGGSVGQRVSIVPSIAGLKLKYSTNFQLSGGYTTPLNERILAVGRIYTFEQILPNVWREIPNSTPLSGDSSLRPNATSITGSLYYDTSLERPIFRNAANNAFLNALGGQLSKSTITGKLSPTTISEQNAVLSSIVSALVAAGVVTDGRT